MERVPSEGGAENTILDETVMNAVALDQSSDSIMNPSYLQANQSRLEEEKKDLDGTIMIAGSVRDETMLMNDSSLDLTRLERASQNGD